MALSTEGGEGLLLIMMLLMMFEQREVASWELLHRAHSDPLQLNEAHAGHE